MTVQADSVPGAPGRLPLLGHVTRLAADPLGFFHQLRDVGPVVRIGLGRRTCYVVTTPELVRHLLITSRGEYDKGGPFLRPFIELWGDGLGTCPAEHHRVQRPLLQPAFAPSRIAKYQQCFARCSVEHFEGWRSGQVIDVDAEMHMVTTAGLTHALFDDPVSRRAVAQFKADLPVILSGLLLRIVLPGLARVPLPVNRRFSAAVDRIDQSVAAMIAHRRHSDQDYDDLLSLLLNPQSHAPGTFDDTMVKNQVFGFLVGGFDSTAILATWTLHLLSIYPQHYEHVVAEIDTALGGQLPTYADLARLPYLHRCLQEVLRLYPPVWMLSRTTRRPAVLGGHQLPENADVFFSIWTLQRDPDIFPDPDRFDPDRWLETRASQRQRDALLPFGAGARKCIGKDFGRVEAATMLTVLLQRWEVRAKPGAKVKTQIRLGSRPVGVELVLRRRSTVAHGARHAEDITRDNASA